MPYTKQKLNDKSRHSAIPAESDAISYFMRTMSVSRMQVMDAIKAVGSNREKLLQYLWVQMY